MNKIILLFFISILCSDAFAGDDKFNGKRKLSECEVDESNENKKKIKIETHKIFTKEEKNEIFEKVVRKLKENNFVVELNRYDVIQNDKLYLHFLLIGKQRAKEKVIEILTDMVWIKKLDLSGNGLTSLPANIAKLKGLKELDLSENQFKSLPVDIFGLTQLKTLRLSYNPLKSLPSQIGELIQLKELDLSHNYLESLPVDMSKLKNIKRLFLDSNCLNSLTFQIEKLIQLKELDLSGNEFESLPAAIWKLRQLESLKASYIKLTELPAEIGNMVNLYEVDLSNNQLAFLPSSIANIQTLGMLDLSGNPFLLPQGQSEVQWGRQELRAHFGDRVMLNQSIIQSMPTSTKKEDVYQALDQYPLRLNRSLFVDQKLPDINVDHAFTGDEMLDALASIIADLNFFDPEKTDYLSYEVLANDFASDARNQNISNFDKVARFLLPRLTGYIKTLYDLPLTENEIAGWKMYQEQIPETQKMLTFVLQKIQEQADSDTKMLLFYQLVNGLLHCPTGQTEGINSVVYAMLENTYKTSDFKTDLEHYLALKKNDAFGMAILSRGGENSQNVHLISFYRDQLKDELGLNAAIASYHERMGIFGQDPFSGDQWNVVQVFYDLVSPARLIDWAMSKTETDQDRQDDFDLRQLSYKNLSAEEKTKEILRLRTKTKLNRQNRNFTIGNIARYLYSENLISDNEQDERWKNYFTADPINDDFALLTRDGVKQILIHMGFLIEDTPQIYNQNNNNNNNFDNKDVITD